MRTFKVQWEDVGFEDCSTPAQAAKQARENIVNGETLCFTVIDNKTKEEYSIDLDDEEDEGTKKIPVEKEFHLVFETGAGLIHGGFFNYSDAAKRIKELQEETGMYCYETIQSI